MKRRVDGLHAGMWLAIALAVAACSETPDASPSASSGPAGGDPRSSGEGPGLIGDPGTAILIVLAIAFASVVVTSLYVRLTSGRSRP